jgi:hypothetical protein
VNNVINKPQLTLAESVALVRFNSLGGVLIGAGRLLMCGGALCAWLRAMRDDAQDAVTAHRY